MNSFYYKGNVYVLPKEEDEDVFLTQLRSNSFVAVLKLLKNHCVAPYFIEEDCSTVMMKIEDPDLVIPCDSSLYSRKDYLEILSHHIHANCEGCIHYESARKDPSVCERRMCLDGNCFYYLPERKYFLKVSCDAFWMEFALIEENVTNLLRKEKPVFAKNQVQQLYNKFINAGAYMALNYVNDRPALMLSGLSDTFVQLLSEYLISRAPKEILEKWDLYSYLPKDVYAYKPVSAQYDLNVLSPSIAYQEVDADHPRFEYRILYHDCTDPKVKVHYENYRYLCSKIGENLLINSAYDWAFVEELESNEVYSAEEIYKMLSQYYGDRKLNKYSHSMNSFSYRFESLEHGLIRGGPQTSRSYCSELTFKMALFSTAPSYQTAMDILNLTCAYIEIDKNEAMIEYFRNTLVPILTKRGICFVVGYESSDSKFYLDFLVTDVALMKQKLRDLSLEFEKMNAIYTEIEKEQRVSYRISYKMEMSVNQEFEKLN